MDSNSAQESGTECNTKSDSLSSTPNEVGPPKSPQLSPEDIETELERCTSQTTQVNACGCNPYSTFATAGPFILGNISLLAIVRFLNTAIYF